MTEFERITESTETLAAFLASLPCIEGPWNEAFHERFCNYCPAKEYSALEAGKVLDISLNAAKILNEEKDIDWAMAISAAQSIGIYDRG